MRTGGVEISTGGVTLIVMLCISSLRSGRITRKVYAVVTFGHACCAPNGTVTDRPSDQTSLKYAVLTFSSSQCSIVHCPRSTVYASAQNLITAGAGLGVNVAVGGRSGTKICWPALMRSLGRQFARIRSYGVELVRRAIKVSVSPYWTM